MKTNALGATIERQIASRYRTKSFWISLAAPILIIGLLLFQTANATDNPSSTMFLTVLSAIWAGGSACVREIVDERKLVQREPHLSLLAYAVAKILHAALMAAGQSLILTVFMLFSGVVLIPFFSFWTILFLTTISGALLALILSALCDEPATALAWFPLLLIPQVVFGGFLFSYGSATPFHPATDQIVVMPDELTRKPVTQGGIKAAGAICISRWALESLAAETVNLDLSDSKKLENAIQVAGVIPLTLSDEDVSQTLLGYVKAKATGQSVSPPEIDTHRGRYFLVLALFAAVQAVLLIVILPLRDPRRT